jgi:hypothetical protein
MVDVGGAVGEGVGGGFVAEPPDGQKRNASKLHKANNSTAITASKIRTICVDVSVISDSQRYTS